MNNIYQFDNAGLKNEFKQLGIPAFRAKQVWDWLYTKGCTDFEAMTNLPKTLRHQLADQFHLGSLELATEQVSKDGTQKRVYRLPDGQLIESVLMPYADGRRTACISSQAGCAMRCAFCATGQMGFARHLSTEEIFEQALIFAQELQQEDQRLSNVVLMGMGEPFHNYDSVIAAIHLLMERLGIGARRITVSTVGLVPKIRAFTQEGLQVKLAISLHATKNEVRSAMMPVNNRYSIEELIDACRDYVAVSRRRITFEWALIAGQNDSSAQAHELGRLLKGLMCHVNVIPLNPTAGFEGAPTAAPAAAQFIEVLSHYGIPGTVRVRRGIDIDAGCGQLKSKVLRRNGK